jgi:ADP-L-glycero-D-manno-heptose 6-epimerase
MQYIIVTGAAGFIGSNLVRALNARGERDIIAVDHLGEDDRFKNLVDCDIADYLDRAEFIGRVADGEFDDNVKVIFHQGACSDTMESDADYMMQINYRYTISLLEHCQNCDIPFIYASSASVYGDGKVFVEDIANEKPLNVYAYSKFLADQFVRRVLPERTAPIVGLRYFNVYGPREQHKGRMASVVYHFSKQFRETGKIKLFEGCDGYAAGEQLRDFISVDDVVAINLYFYDHPRRSGIYNVGTGQASSFNQIAAATLNALTDSQKTAADWVRDGVIEYTPFPEKLIGKYQSYTQADLSQLRKAGYKDAFLTVDEGVRRYIDQAAF